MSTQQRSENRQILQEASEWFVDFRFGEIDNARRSEFMQWLRRSPEHIRAYMEISSAYARLPTAASVGEGETQRLLDKLKSRSTVTTIPGIGELESIQAVLLDKDARSGRERRWRPLLAAAVAALSILLPLTAWLVLTKDPIYATATAEQRSITLEDGSKLELNARTKIKVAFKEHARHIDLIEGQALFRVAKDPYRPFTVNSAGVNVRALGTRFDVRMRKSGTTVTVLEGRVAIRPPASLLPAGEEAASTVARLELTAGEQVIFTATSVTKPPQPNVDAAVAWTQGELEFDETPLADVVEEFNRYNRVPLVIDSPAVGNFRISGIYSSEDPSALIRFLQSQPDLVVTAEASEIRIRHK